MLSLASVLYWVQSIVSVLLSVLGVLVISGNLVILVANICDPRHRSFVSFVGGILGAIGLSIAPWPRANSFWWVPLLLDVTCIPLLALLVAALITLPFRRKRRNRNKGNAD